MPATTLTPATPETGQPEPDLAAERLADSVDEAARLTGLPRDLLYDQMRCGNLTFIKVGRRPLITALSMHATRIPIPRPRIQGNAA